jgi:hypothetical protein
MPNTKKLKPRTSMTTSNMRGSLRRYFRLRSLQPFRTAELRWITGNKRMILCDREVPRRAYIFEVAVKTTL